MEGLSGLLPSLHVSRLAGALLIVLSVVAGYLFAAGCRAGEMPRLSPESVRGCIT